MNLILKIKVFDASCWDKGFCSDTDSISGKVTQFSKHAFTKDHCLTNCGIYGASKCKSFTHDPATSSCIFHQKPCANLNTTCSDCFTWNGKCNPPSVPHTPILLDKADSKGIRTLSSFQSCKLKLVKCLLVQGFHYD